MDAQRYTNARLPEQLTLDPAPAVVALLNEHALTGGKQMRPRLVLEVGRILGLATPELLPYAIAAERVHCATLLHDDVIDEANVRRDRPTLNSVAGNRKAVLGGDLLLARALKELSAMGNLPAIQSLLEVLVQLTQGEWLQWEARFELGVSERHLRTVAGLKTASLIGWCTSVSAATVGYTSTQQTALRNWGNHLGVAFQIGDDAIDYSPTSGKPFAKDLEEGQVNFVVCKLLEARPALEPEVTRFLHNLALSVLDHASPLFKTALQEALIKTARLREQELLAAEQVLRTSTLPAAVIHALQTQIAEPFAQSIQGAQK